MADPPNSGPTGTILTYEQMYGILKQQGATNYEADQLTALALGEGRGTIRTNAVNDTSIETSYGPFQINLDVHSSMNKESAQDPVAAAFFALSLFRSRGPQPWSVSHDEWRGTAADYRQYLHDDRPESGEQTAWAGSLKDSGAGASGPGGVGVMTPPDQFGAQGALEGSELGLDSGGANFNFEWPTIDDYNGDFQAWMDVTGIMAATYGAAGIQMPAGVSEFANAAWHVANTDAESGAIDPSTVMLNNARAAEIAQLMRQKGILFPYDLQKIQQDIRLAEPFGAEKVVRTPLGQAGFNDYWADGGPKNPTNSDYMAGYNLARSGDEPRQSAVTSYLDRVVEEVGQEIEIRGQNITAATEEMRNRVNLFDNAQRAFKNIQPYTIPSGSEYIPGFEPGGFATSIGLKSRAATPISYDPFQMAIDVDRSTPAPTSFVEPTVRGTYDDDMFNTAMNFIKGLL